MSAKTRILRVVFQILVLGFINIPLYSNSFTTFNRESHINNDTAVNFKFDYKGQPFEVVVVVNHRYYDIKVWNNGKFIFNQEYGNYEFHYEVLQEAFKIVWIDEKPYIYFASNGYMEGTCCYCDPWLSFVLIDFINNKESSIAFSGGHCSIYSKGETGFIPNFKQYTIVDTETQTNSCENPQICDFLEKRYWESSFVYRPTKSQLELPEHYAKRWAIDNVSFTQGREWGDMKLMSYDTILGHELISVNELVDSDITKPVETSNFELFIAADADLILYDKRIGKYTPLVCGRTCNHISQNQYFKGYFKDANTIVITSYGEEMMVLHIDSGYFERIGNCDVYPLAK